MKYYFLILTFISLNSYALDGCNKANTQFELTKCALHELKQTEIKLSNKIDEMSAIMTEDKVFSVANNKWIQYKNYHCKSVADINSGGSIYNYILTQCEIDITKARLKTLNSDYKSTLNIITKGAP